MPDARNLQLRAEIDAVRVEHEGAEASLSSTLTITNGDLIDANPGRALKVKEGGAAARMGRVSLVGGTISVNTTAITALSEVLLCCQVPAGTPGHLRVSARTPGSSFTITSSDALDTSAVAWLLIEPAP